MRAGSSRRPGKAVRPAPARQAAPARAKRAPESAATAPEPASFAVLEDLARKLAVERQSFARQLAKHGEQLARTRARNLPRLRAGRARLDAAHGALAEAVRAHPGLFEKPRTRILHGIKVGFQKTRPRVVFDDAKKVVAKIRAKMPEHFDALVQTSEIPRKTALADLAPKELRSIGVRLESSHDEVVIAPVDADVERLLAAAPEVSAADQGSASS